MGEPVYWLGVFHVTVGWVVSQMYRCLIMGAVHDPVGMDPVAADLDQDGNEELIIQHEMSGRVWIPRGGVTFGLRYLGDLVAGPTEREWLIATGKDTFGLLALTRD